MKDIIIFTDGSCCGNGTLGAVGGIGIHFPNGELKDLSHVYKGRCTNQRAELYAILTALRYIKKHLKISKCRIFIKTDSKYSIDCVTKWIKKWLQNNWKTTSGGDVLNRDLIEKIHNYYVKYNVILIHVEAHTDNDDDDSVANAIADRLATKASQRAIMRNKSSGSKKSYNNKNKKHEKNNDKKNYHNRRNANIEVELIGA